MKLIKLNKDHYIIVDDSEKMTHSTSVFDEHNLDLQNISLQEIKELIGEVDVDKKVEEVYPQTYYSGIHIDGFLKAGYVKGYNQALEDNKDKKYTEKDLKRYHNIMCLYGNVKGEEYIQSLQPKTEWEVEFIDNKLKLL